MRCCKPCSLALLADHERVEPLTDSGCGVHHGRGNRVSPEGEAADCLEVPVGNQGPHHPADNRRRRSVQGDPSHVDVVVGGTSRSQDDPAIDDRQSLDLRNQLGSVLGDGRRAHHRTLTE